MPGFCKDGYSIERFLLTVWVRRFSLKKRSSRLEQLPWCNMGMEVPDEQLKQAQPYWCRSWCPGGFPTDIINGTKLLKRAHKKNIKVIAYERLLHITDVDYYFHFAIKRLAASRLNMQLRSGPKGNYILLGGPVYDYNSILYHAWAKNHLAPYIERGDIKI